MESVRIDKWLVAVRIYKTRTLAADACTGGKVRMGGRSVKASAVVRPGDRLSVAVAPDWTRELEVVRLIEKRVGAAIAAECLIDHGPPRPVKERDLTRPAFERESGAGRPTKRDRRKIDRLRGR